jgi:Tol biopolymer transport system component
MFRPIPLKSVCLAIIGSISVLALGACGLLTEDTFIAYSVGEVGARDIVVARSDGGDRRIVIAGPGDDFSPVWSPDHSRIAFLTNRDGNVELYIGLVDGSSVTRVTNTGVDESQPTWSPDGQRIAYVSPDEDGTPRVYWVRFSDLLPNRLIFESNSEADPAWSPSGTWVAFAGLDQNGNSEGLFLRNPDGVNRLQLSASPDRHPVWSPDGKKIVFTSTRDGDEEIYVLQVGVSGPEGQAVRITNNPASDFSPTWSPDSKRVAFISDRNDSRDIFTVSDKGEDILTLTRNQVEELHLVWGPTGKLVFESRPSGKSELFVTTTGGAQNRLSVGDVAASQPDW